MPILNKKRKMKRLRLRIALNAFVPSVKLRPRLEHRMENSVDNRREHVRCVPPRAHPALWCSLHGNAGFPGNPTSPPSGVALHFSGSPISHTVTFRVDATLDFDFCFFNFYFFPSCHALKEPVAAQRNLYKKKYSSSSFENKVWPVFLSVPIAPPTGLSGDAASARNVGYLLPTFCSGFFFCKSFNVSPKTNFTSKT